MGDQENAAASPPEEPVNNVSEAMAAVNLEAVEKSENENAVCAEQELLRSLVKVYVGSLPPDLDEDGLKVLLSDKSAPTAETVLVKRGYAFLEFTDQTKADEAISVLDGLECQGHTLRAEMSVGTDKKGLMSTSYKVIVSNVPADTPKEDIDSLLKEVSPTVLEVNVNNSDFVTLTFPTKDDAERAVNELQETEFRGQTLQARLSERRSPRRTGAGLSSLSSGGSGNQRHVEFPLRILVQSDMVGAIIGRGGQTIRQITQQTRARVDVHRKDSVGSVEKAITIYGQPENCSNACLQILKVMQEEARNTEKSDDIPLKILAHNNLIGRIIGKQGSTIKKIMEDTDTKITVSSINEINSFNMERIITIRGEPEKVCRAEAEVSSKLRQAYESDLNSMPPQNIMFSGLHPATASMVPPLGMGLTFNAGLHHQPSHVRMAGGPSPAFLGGYYAGPTYNGGGVAMNSNKPGGGGPAPPPPAGPATQSASMQGYGLVSPQDPSLVAGPGGGGGSLSASITGNGHGPNETVHMYIPNSAVGAVIGAKGSYIRDLNKYSGYSIKIASSGDDTNGYPAAVNSTDRRVTIIGPSDRFWAPQYLIYEKLKIEGFTDPHDGDVPLTIEMFVPSSQVGRIIGKGGTNVRELQRLTGAIIKLPEQLSPPPKDETSVVIIGKWIQALTAQQRLRAMLAMAVNSSTPAAATTPKYPTPVNGTTPSVATQPMTAQAPAAAAVALPAAVKTDEC